MVDQTLTAQLATTGPKPVTSFVASLGKDILTPSGFIQVKPTLQIEGYPHIFAGGDAIQWNEQKSARKAFQHALTIFTNLQALLKDPNTAVLKEYKTPPEALMLTNGKVRCMVAWVLFGSRALMIDGGIAEWGDVLLGHLVGADLWRLVDSTVRLEESLYTWRQEVLEFVDC